MWAAFTAWCVIVLPTSSELNSEFPQFGPVVLPIPDSLHLYLAPWNLSESMPWRLGVAVTASVVAVAVGLIVRYGGGAAKVSEG